MFRNHSLPGAIVAAAVLALSVGSARADMCFGAKRPVPVRPQDDPAARPDAGASRDGGVSWNGTGKGRLGAGLLFAAAISTGWLCFRRKGEDC